MLPLVLPYPGIDPVAFTLGPIGVRWYGLAYAAGLILGWLYIRTLVSNRALWGPEGPPLDAARADNLVFWVMAGLVVGGRLGAVLLYEPGYYLSHPLEIVQVWKGGMSFHGGVLGVIAALFLFAWRHGLQPRPLADLACAGVPFGMFLGRLANFINSEHWGHPTDVPWAMVFPNGGPMPRHPSQLYEAFLEGIVMIVLLRIVTHRLHGLAKPGLVTGVWLSWYAIARGISELFRQPEVGHPLNLGPFTAGQIYSIPMLLLGAYLIYTATAAGESRAKRA